MHTRRAVLAMAPILTLAACSTGGFGVSNDPLGAPGVAGVSDVDGLIVGHRLMAAGEYELALKAYTRAYDILSEKKEDWERLAQGLLEYETLTGDEITKVIAGEPLNRGDDEDDTPDSGGTASVTAIPKTKPRKKPSEGDGGLEPEPTG